MGVVEQRPEPRPEQDGHDGDGDVRQQLAEHGGLLPVGGSDLLAQELHEQEDAESDQPEDEQEADRLYVVDYVAGEALAVRDEHPRKTSHDARDDADGGDLDTPHGTSPISLRFPRTGALPVRTAI